MLFLLFLFLLLPYSSLALLECSKSKHKTCLNFHGCNFSISTLDGVTSNLVNKTCDNGSFEYISIQFNIVTSYYWDLDVFSSFPSLTGHTLYFGHNSFHFLNANTLIVTVDGKKKDFSFTIHNYGNTTVHGISLSDPLWESSYKTRWLDHFAGSNISMNSSSWSLEPTSLMSFWDEIAERTKCEEDDINDACVDNFGDCVELWTMDYATDGIAEQTKMCQYGNAFWMNEGSVDEERWRRVYEVKCTKGRWIIKPYTDWDRKNEEETLMKRELICASALPVSCDPLEVRKECDGDCKYELNVTRRIADCPRGVDTWLAMGGSFANDWQIGEMRCSNGSWEWKAGNPKLDYIRREPFRPYKKEKLACSIGEPPQMTNLASNLIIWGSVAVGIIIFAVIIGLLIWCWCCYGKNEKQPNKPSKSTSASNTEMESEMSSLRVNNNPNEKNRSGSSPRKSQESSSNVSSALIPDSSGEEEKGKRKSDRN